MGLLATTALECTWGDTEQLLFLGEWCKRYERSSQWQARTSTVVDYHWDDRDKLRRDQHYLKALHHEILGELAGILGKHHGLDRNLRYWQVILDPWLSRYVAVLFDRWECLRVAFERHAISRAVAVRGDPRVPVRHQLEFIDAASDDDWNQEVFEDILRFEYADRCSITDISAPTQGAAGSRISSLTTTPRDWKWSLASRLDQLLGVLGRNSHIALVRPYFPLRAYLRLCLALRKVPTFYLRDFEWPQTRPLNSDPAAGSVRASIVLQRHPANRFESFLHGRIGSELPQVFVELFAGVGRFCEEIRVNPKVIFTANDHANNDLFKRWAAQKIHEGIPLVIMEHGSGIPALFSSMECEEEIADVKITWSKPYHSKHVRLPANKLAGRRRHAGTAPRGRLLVVGQEMPRYAFDALSMPIGAQTLTGFNFICTLHDRLNARPQSAFLVKPYPNLGWRTRDRFRARLGAEKVSTEANLELLMRRSRMIVCTYPQTTFSEALNSGVPTVLVYARHYWETVPSFDELIRILCDARIVFFDPAAAADHINAVWEDPMTWWRSAGVTQALQEYAAEAADVRRDWIKPWTAFMRRMLSGPYDKPGFTVPIGKADE